MEEKNIEKQLIEDKIEHLESLRILQKGLDDIIEEMQMSFAPLESSLDKIYSFLQETLNINGFYIKIHDETLKEKNFVFGSCAFYSDEIASEVSSEYRQSYIRLGKNVFFIQPMDVVGTIIGKIAISYDVRMMPQNMYAFDFLDCISELLDNYCFNIYASSVKNSLYTGIQSALKNPSLRASIDTAVELIYPYVKFKKLFFVFSDRELTGNETIHYLYYENGVRMNHSTDSPSSEFDRFIHNHKYYLEASYSEIRELLKDDNVKLSYLRNYTGGKEMMGMVAHTWEKNNYINSVLSKELYDVFLDEICQRLVDMNREQTMLRKNFSNLVVDQLMHENDYMHRFLSPKQAEIGVLFADLCAFTKISEQILKEPERISSFVSRWSKSVVKRIFPLGGCLDKVVGDCTIFLFGPPFYRDSKETIVRHLLQASKLIVKYTNDFLNLPENSDLVKHPNFKDFGVSIGVNLCPVVVGLIGPNEELTAFGSGMNNTARLQGIAGNNTILVSESVYDVAMKTGEWNFSEPLFTKVKNVQEPLKHYKLIYELKNK